MNKLLFLIVSLIAFSNANAKVDPKEVAERAIYSVKMKYAPDSRTAVFDYVFYKGAKVWVLKGKTNIPEARQAVSDSLARYNLQFIDSTKLLPEFALGQKTWGIATLSVANIRVAAGHTSEMVTQALMGTPVKVLEKLDGWYHIQTPEKYLGWVDEKGIVLLTEVEIGNWQQCKRIVFRKMNGYLYSTPDENSMPVSDLVLDDILELIGTSGDIYKVKLPDGRTGFIKKADCTTFEDWASQIPDVNKLIILSSKMMGTPYLWGGNSTKGVDCSGFVKMLWYDQAVFMPRDASQQFWYGEKIDPVETSTLQKGDLIFIGKGSRHITHVGIYIGEGYYIQASGLVRINSINSFDSAYDFSEKRNIISAVRTVHAIGEKGIVQIKNHPWYVGEKPSAKN